MDPQVITDIITRIGFPIVAAGALFWYVNKLQESHKEETKAMRESINQNTIVLTELKELISSVLRELAK